MNKYGGRDPPGKYHAAEKRRKIKQNCGKEKETLMDSASGGICFSALHETDKRTEMLRGAWT